MFNNLFHKILLLNAIPTPNPFTWLGAAAKNAGDFSTLNATVTAYSNDIYDVLMWAGFFGAVISLIFYRIVKYMIQAGSLSPRLAYERKEAMKQIIIWTIVLSLVIGLFGAIQKLALYFG